MLSTKLSSSTAAAVAAGWDVTKATFNGTPKNYINVSDQEPTPLDIFFKPDGTKMYVIGNQNRRVNEYDLSSAWDVSTATYLQAFNVASQELSPQGLFFKPDGTKMYITGSSGDDVNEYDLSVAWDVSTASYSQNFYVGTQDTVPQGLFFKPDGTKMYITGSSGDNVNEYDLSTAWDVSTASYSQNFYVGTQEATPQGLFFKPDGTKMYVVGSSLKWMNEYNLSSAWDVSTASFLQRFTGTAFVESAPSGISFKPDGTRAYIVGYSGKAVRQWDLSTAWNVTTMSYTFPSTEYFKVQTQDTSPFDIFFKSDGTKMYILGNSNDRVNEYNLSTAWNISTASYLQNFSVAAEETNPQGFFFKPNGTKMYIIGQSGDDVSEYDLSSAWDISTASYLQNFSVIVEEPNATNVFFKPDGTKMYVVGTQNRRVNEYDLSTAWDISTASYLQNFSVQPQELNPQGLFFKPDGRKMYVCGFTGDDVNEYNLSVAWDVTSASYLQNFFTGSEELAPYGLFFYEDGTKMYIVGNDQDAVWSYDL